MAMLVDNGSKAIMSPSTGIFQADCAYFACRMLADAIAVESQAQHPMPEMLDKRNIQRLLISKEFILYGGKDSDIASPPKSKRMFSTQALTSVGKLA